MTSFFSDFVFSYLFLAVFLIPVYFSGHLILAFVNQNEKKPFKTFFVKLSLGLIFIVVTYAIIRTHFLTIFNGVIITAAFYFFLNREKFSLDIEKNLRKIELQPVFWYLIGLFIVTLSVVFLFHFDNRLFLHQDLAYYGRLASSFFQNGIEVNNNEPFLYGEIKFSLYHYFNEWLVALFLHFSRFTSLKTLLILVVPLLSTVTFMGGAAITEKFLPKVKTYEKGFISFLILLIPGLLSFFVFLLTRFSLNAPYSILHGGIVILKIKIVLILMLLFLMNDKEKFEEKNFLPLVLIPLFWSTLIPVFLGGYLLYFFYKVFRKDFPKLKMVVLWIVPLAYMPIHLLVANHFYGETGTQATVLQGYGLTDYLLETYSNFDYLIKTFALFILPALGLFFLAITVFPKIIRHFQTKYKLKSKLDVDLVFFLLFIALSALVSFGILRELFNARQILMNLFYPAITISIFVLMLLLFRSRLVLLNLGLVILYTLTISAAVLLRPENKRDDSLLVNKIETLAQEKENYLIASDIQKDLDPFFVYSKPYSWLLTKNEKFKPIRIDLFPYQPLKTPAEKVESVLGSQPFFKYVRFHELQENIEEGKVRFINEFKIDFLLVSEEILNEKENYLQKIDIDTVIPFDKEVYLARIKHTGN